MQYSARHRSKQRGAVLLSVLALAVIIAAITGACAYSMTTWSGLAVTKSNVLTATELAEAGINTELNYIAVQSRAGNSNWYHANTTQAGEPLPGNAGSPSSVGWYGPSGRYWVYTTPVNSGTAGAGFTITCEAEVGGSITTSHGVTTLSGGARRTVTISGTSDSLFNLYGAYGTGTSSTTPAVNVASGGSLTTNGSIGTNGKCSFSGSESHTCAINANCNNSNFCGHQFSGSCQKNPYSCQFPSTKSLVCTTFPSCQHGSEWSYLSTHNCNNCIKMYKPGLSGNTGICSTSTMPANFSCSHTTLCNYSGNNGWNNGQGTNSQWWWQDQQNNSWKYDNQSCGGDWAYKSNNQGCNHTPGSSTDTAIILPPGDYYFSQIDCSQFSSCTHFIIDNADLCEGGVNAGKPVRIWIGADNSSANDCMNIPFEFTDNSANGTKTFRCFYGKDNCSLTLQNSDSSQHTCCGSVYAVSAESHGCSVNLCGGSHSWNCQNVQGSVVGDCINASGQCNINPVAGNCTPYDYCAGTGYLTSSTYSVCGGR